jgi:hypothetical protein
MTAASALKLVTEEVNPARRHPRVKVLLSAKLSTTIDEAEVKVRDLSLGGAMLQGRALPRVGTDVVLSRGSFEIFATIVWLRANLCGVEFDTPIAHHEEVLQAWAPQKRSTSIPTPLPHLPLLASAPLSVEEMSAAREWAFPQGRQAYRD